VIVIGAFFGVEEAEEEVWSEFLKGGVWL